MAKLYLINKAISFEELIENIEQRYVVIPACLFHPALAGLFFGFGKNRNVKITLTLRHNLLD
ncbi:hypothetical protein [Sporomusa acidovorans]